MQLKKINATKKNRDDIKSMKRVEYGLCCISLRLKQEGWSYKSMTAKKFLKLNRVEGINRLCSIYENNLEVMYNILKMCNIYDIRHYRITSNIFALITYEKIGLKLEDLPNYQKLLDKMGQIGDYAKTKKIGLSFHPSQYIVIASKKPQVREVSAVDINFAAKLLDMFKTKADWASPINVHINSPMSETFVSDFEDGLSKLSQSARKRLVIENEDRGYWNVKNLSIFLKKYDIPITFDFLHHYCNNAGESQQEAFMEAVKTWKNIKPIFHYAESLSLEKPRSHSQYCNYAPPYYGIDYICQIEAKAKEIAIEQLRRIENGHR